MLLSWIMKKVTVSAPGKIHLMGEHTVVYGKPALLSAINKRLIVTIEGSKAVNSRPGLEAGEIQIRTIPQEADSYIRHAINVACRSLRKELPSIQILVKTDIPPGFHLGSSAAIAVATVGAMYYYFTKKWDLEKINALSYEVEKKMHGNPSGGDNTTVTYGGFIRYQKISETKKIFEKLPLSLSKNLQHFYLIDTGRPKENTGIMVVLVREQYNKNPNKFNAIFDTNEKQVERILEALKTGDEKTLIDAIQKGEQTLEDMGVVNDKVKPLIREIEKAGGAAKILGGGGISDGVGFLLCYHHNVKSIQPILKQYGYAIQKVILGEEGVRIETK